MLNRFREVLTLALIALLPFHALFVTTGTKLLRGAGHAPWGVLALWKEGLLVLILLIAALEISGRMLSGKWKVESGKFLDWIDGAILCLLVIAVSLYFYRPWMTTTGFAFGFKYDFIPLIAFLILRRAPWSQWFWTQAERLLLGVGGAVALYGIFTLLLPQSFFSLLGYSDAHSLYLPAKPLAAFQQISGSSIRRIQSTFSGPNQFGIWLLIPLSVAALRILRLRMKNYELPARPRPGGRIMILALVLLLALFLTFSRSAWIGAFVIFAVLAYRALPRKVFMDVLIGGFSIVMIVGVAASLLMPSLFLRRTSTWGHVVRPIMALKEMKRYPLGMGLGSAGPAANRTHEPCVYLERGADPSWAKASPQLCVFVGDLQIQPADHACDCAMLPENWYLQIGVEMGVVGLILYLAATVILLKRLSVGAIRESPLQVFLIFLAIAVAALFLHAWEDSAVAYTAWIAAAGMIPPWSIRAPSSSSISGASTRI